MGVHLMTIEPRRMQQTHHRCGTLACTQAAGEQLVTPTKRNRPDAVFHPVVVDRYGTVFQVPGHRSPASQAVVDRPDRGTGLRYALALRQHLGM